MQELCAVFLSSTLTQYFSSNPFLFPFLHFLPFIFSSMSHFSLSYFSTPYLFSNIISLSFPSLFLIFSSDFLSCFSISSLSSTSRYSYLPPPSIFLPPSCLPLPYYGMSFIFSNIKPQREGSKNCYQDFMKNSVLSDLTVEKLASKN